MGKVCGTRCVVAVLVRHFEGCDEKMCYGCPLMKIVSVRIVQNPSDFGTPGMNESGTGLEERDARRKTNNYYQNSICCFLNFSVEKYGTAEEL